MKNVYKSLMTSLNQAVQHEKANNSVENKFPHVAYFISHKEKKVLKIMIPYDRYIVDLPDCTWFWCDVDYAEKMINEGYAAIDKLI